jgi:hypothetical protein
VKRQIVLTIALVVLALAPTASRASNGNVGLFFDAEATRCTQHVPCFNGPVRLYVYALLEGASQLGITGAEYKVAVGADNLPDSGWLFAETFDPNATTIGSGAFNPGDTNPPGTAPRGINVAWDGCQLGDGFKVLIETVDILNLNNCGPAELYLTVVKHDTPSNQFFQCPLFVLCDDPTYTKVCLGSNITACRNPEPPFPMNASCSTSGQAIINPFQFHNCTVGVATTSWSAMKGLYR